MLLNTFEYLKPNGLGEVLRVLDELKQKKTQVMAGGTDLIPALRDKSKQPEYVVDLSGAQLDGVVFEKDQVRIGALVTFARLCRDPELWEKLPALAEAAAQVGRCNAATWPPSAATCARRCRRWIRRPPLMVLDAKFRLQAQGRERMVAAEEFFLGPRKTVLQPGEILTEIVVPLEEGFHASFRAAGAAQGADLVDCERGRRAGRRSRGEIAKVRIALGAVAPTPIRARQGGGGAGGQEAYAGTAGGSGGGGGDRDLADQRPAGLGRISAAD